MKQGPSTDPLTPVSNSSSDIYGGASGTRSLRAPTKVQMGGGRQPLRVKFRRPGPRGHTQVRAQGWAGQQGNVVPGDPTVQYAPRSQAKVPYIKPTNVQKGAVAKAIQKVLG